MHQKRKESLLDAAYELLRTKTYRSITIRDISSKAGIQSAMIKYYFGNKQGLFLALLERLSNQQLDTFADVSNAAKPIRSFIGTALSFFSQHPPVVRLVVDEVLSGDSHLREAFIEMAPKRVATMLPQLIRSQQQAGHLRQDLDPKWAAFSLLSLIMTPFILGAARELAWKISDGDISGDRWADHIYQLFINGVGK